MNQGKDSEFQLLYVGEMQWKKEAIFEVKFQDNESYWYTLKEVQLGMEVIDQYSQSTDNIMSRAHSNLGSMTDKQPLSMLEAWLEGELDNQLLGPLKDIRDKIMGHKRPTNRYQVVIQKQL